MPELSGLFTAEHPRTTWLDRVKTIVPPALVGLLFVLIGYTKFDDDPRGQWFRIFTGVVQVTGGVLMCIPKTMLVGAIMLTCTMIGAAFVDLVVIHMPFFIVPMFLAIVIVVVAMLCRE